MKSKQAEDWRCAVGEFEQGRDTSELRQEFESFLIATCADYKYWLKRYVYFNGHLYSPVNYRDSCHCAKASKISTALLVWNHQQSKIEQLEEENAHLAEINKRYLGKMQEQQDQIASVKDVIKKHDRYIPQSTINALEKALRGES